MLSSKSFSPSHNDTKVVKTLFIQVRALLPSCCVPRLIRGPMASIPPRFERDGLTWTPTYWCVVTCYIKWENYCKMRCKLRQLLPYNQIRCGADLGKNGRIRWCTDLLLLYQTNEFTCYGDMDIKLLCNLTTIKDDGPSPQGHNNYCQGLQQSCCVNSTEKNKATGPMSHPFVPW